MSNVLVTGGSGFIGSHCILKLLQAGHTVRTTVRTVKREPEVRAMLARGGVDAGNHLSFVAADLEQDHGWKDAVAGIDYVLHVASPFPSTVPKNENELIIPAREGTLRVLRAARDAGVKRVVLTSSFAAIGYGHERYDKLLDEHHWSNTDAPDISAYAKSKTLAERAAWGFVKAEGGGLELSVVNPVGVFGPLLGTDISTSVEVIRRMLAGQMPGIPHVSIGVVDVRDVADLHLLAMTSPAANNERFLCTADDFISFADVAAFLRKSLGERASKVPTRAVPSWLLRFAGIFNPEVRLLLPELDKTKNATNAKARTLLGWKPRTNEQAIVSTAESLISMGMIKGLAA